MKNTNFVGVYQPSGATSKPWQTQKSRLTPGGKCGAPVCWLKYTKDMFHHTLYPIMIRFTDNHSHKFNHHLALPWLVLFPNG